MKFMIEIDVQQWLYYIFRYIYIRISETQIINFITQIN